ncbi:MAG: sensor histidine kinase [Lachnospiraceae bacterium]|nr:sensor histidine kinase [Lachnospiraceae bacterium]
MLLNSADKIANNCLDFTMEKARPNELGMVCDAFEKMRCSLYETSQENFRILEERRRLNAAFAHDMRNPVTVLKGYIDLLERYIPEERISREKEMEIIGMVHGQVLRLENYVRKMSAVQKLEDIAPAYENVDYGEFISLCTETAKQIDERVSVRAEKLSEECAGEETLSRITIRIDKELVLEVMENLLANASVYTKDRILLTITNRGKALELRVEDNGGGFSEEALKLAGSPFYREENGKSRQHSGGQKGNNSSSQRRSDFSGHFGGQKGNNSNSQRGSDLSGHFGGQKGNNSSSQRGSDFSGHFGLGLYICKLICEKCSGGLYIENSSEGSGGVVTAIFGL